jgi:ribonucleotide reductase alpha subunit
MFAAVASFIDSAISKTVNVQADYPYEDLKKPLLDGLALRRQSVGNIPTQPRYGRDLFAERRCDFSLGMVQ